MEFFQIFPLEFLKLCMHFKKFFKNQLKIETPLLLILCLLKLLHYIGNNFPILMFLLLT